jgi:hypothetical protein
LDKSCFLLLPGFAQRFTGVIRFLPRWLPALSSRGINACPFDEVLETEALTTLRKYARRFPLFWTIARGSFFITVAVAPAAAAAEASEAAAAAAAAAEAAGSAGAIRI